MDYKKIISEKIKDYTHMTRRTPNVVVMDKTTYRVFHLSEDYVKSAETKFNSGDMFLGLNVAVLAGCDTSELRVGRV